MYGYKHAYRYTLIEHSVYKITGAHCDCGALFYRCHDILAWQ